MDIVNSIDEKYRKAKELGVTYYNEKNNLAGNCKVDFRVEDNSATFVIRCLSVTSTTDATTGHTTIDGVNIQENLLFLSDLYRRIKEHVNTDTVKTQGKDIKYFILLM